MPAPRTMTFVPLGRPDSTGRGPACAAIISHDRIALMTSADPPVRPRRSMKVRLVSGCISFAPRCLYFDLDDRARRDERRDAECGSRRLVRLLRRAEELREGRVHPGGVELPAHGRVSSQVDAHHDDIAHPQALFF